MDPFAAFVAGIAGDRDARAAYNRWVRRGGFKVYVRVRKYTRTWNRGIRRITVRRIDAERVIGADFYNDKTKVSVPFAALDLEEIT